MQVLVLAALVTLAFADVRPLGYQYPLPYSSYDVSQSSITASPKYYRLSPTAPSSHFRLPIHGYQNFVGSGFRFTTPTPNVEINNEIVSSTPAPNVEINPTGYSTPSPLGVEISSPSVPPLNIGSIESSTAAPSIELSTAGFSTPAPIISEGSFGYSTAAPIVNLNAGIVSSTPAPTYFNSFGLNNGFNFGSNAYSTPAPISQFATGSLTSLDSSIFNKDAELNGVQVTTSGGTLIDSFGISTPEPAVVEVQKNVFYFAAPDEEEPIRPRIRIATPAVTKKVNYIFVKAPAPAPLHSVRVSAPPKQEEKTVVYVLVKKPQEEQVIELENPEPQQPKKPEVFFIKYKNQQEAEEAISKVQSGQSSSHEHIAASNIDESNGFVSNLERGTYKTQPIVEYVKSSNLYSQNLPFANVPSSVFYSTTASPILNSGLGYTTRAPIYSGFTASTPVPTLNTFPQLKSFNLESFPSSPINTGFHIGSNVANVVNSLPAQSQNYIDAQFPSSTVAPETIVSSTLDPVSLSSSTPAPFHLSGSSSLFKTSSPFPAYGPPFLIKRKK